MPSSRSGGPSISHRKPGPSVRLSRIDPPSDREGVTSTWSPTSMLIPGGQRLQSIAAALVELCLGISKGFFGRFAVVERGNDSFGDDRPDRVELVLMATGHDRVGGGQAFGPRV